MFKNGAKLTIFLSKMPVFECDVRTVNPCVVSSSLTGAANMQDFVYKSTKILHFCIFMHFYFLQKCQFLLKGTRKTERKRSVKLRLLYRFFITFIYSFQQKNSPRMVKFEDYLISIRNRIL